MNYKGGFKILIPLVVSLVLLTLAFTLHYLNSNNSEKYMNDFENEKIILPQPNKEEGLSVEKALNQRRSVREFSEQELTLQEVSQLLWSAQGITNPEGLRTAPSAGGTYPLETYVVVKNVENLKPGVYRYVPDGHSLEKKYEGDLSTELKDASLGQDFIQTAAINIVFTAEYERTTNVYGERGRMYVHMEVGHAAQNLYLQCESLNLKTVVVGAFNDDDVKRVLSLPESEEPLYVIPIGK